MLALSARLGRGCEENLGGGGVEVAGARSENRETGSRQGHGPGDRIALTSPDHPIMRISKSKFTTGLQCHKKLWWTYHERDAPELVPDAAKQGIFDTGHRVGELAQEHYPGGTLVELDFQDRGGIDKALAQTRELLDAGVTTIYEASFRENGVFVAIDILHQVDGEWVIGEVKSTLSTKPQHITDAAVQAWVARAAGIDVRRIEIVHLNREHRHPDVNPLFVADDITEEAEAFLPSIEGLVAEQIEMLEAGLPDVDIGDHCSQPYDCDFKGRCWPELPANHVSQLYRIGKGASALEEAGYETIDQIPEGHKLSTINQRLRRAVLDGGTVVEPGLREVLDEIEGPVAYLDFETIMPALPIWKGCRPYQQITVQFSVHQRTDAGVKHVEYLADGADDPREALARALIEATDGFPSVLAYHVSFERKRIEELSEEFPNLKVELCALADRLIDLLPIVRANIGHPDFGGSFSLKAVAPALLERGYEGMEVADGGTAAALLKGLLLDPYSLDRDLDELRKDLLAYCERDTQVLVELHDLLEKLADGAS